MKESFASFGFPHNKQCLITARGNVGGGVGCSDGHGAARPPSPNAYDKVKATFLERRSPSTSQRVQRLRALGTLADQKPFDMLRLIERILGRSIEGDVIATEEFPMRLPSQIQLIVRAPADILTVEQLMVSAGTTRFGCQCQQVC